MLEKYIEPNDDYLRWIPTRKHSGDPLEYGVIYKAHVRVEEPSSLAFVDWQDSY